MSRTSHSRGVISRRRALGLLFGCMAIALAACAIPASTLPAPGLRNFHQVNENLYRGAQPDAAGLGSLAQMGIKTVINLRLPDDGWAGEAEAARAAGLTYVNVPVHGVGRPTDEQVTRVLSLIATAAPPIFIHCQRGADRTGTMIACYRLQHDRWDLDRALREAKDHGMAWGQFAMKNYIRDFAGQKKP